MSKPKRWRDWVVDFAQDEYEGMLIITNDDLQDVDINYHRENN